MAEEFWLSDGQWMRLAPLLPNKPRGVRRVDDRRVISGIVHVLKSGGRWADAPPSYGPRKTLYNRFVRWAAKGVWSEVFEALAAAGGPPAKGGAEPSHRPLAWRPDDQDPRACRRLWPAARFSADWRPGSRLPGGRTADRTGACGCRGACRPWLRHRPRPSADRRPLQRSQHPAPV